MMTWALRPHGVRTRGKKIQEGKLLCMVLPGEATLTDSLVQKWLGLR